MTDKGKVVFNRRYGVFDKNEYDMFAKLIDKDDKVKKSVILSDKSK